MKIFLGGFGHRWEKTEFKEKMKDSYLLLTFFDLDKKRFKFIAKTKRGSHGKEKSK